MITQIYAFMLKLNWIPVLNTISILYNEIRSATLPLSTLGWNMKS